MSAPSSIDEGMIIDYLQGALTAADAEALERRLAEDSDARRVVSALAGLSVFSGSRSSAARRQPDPPSRRPVREAFAVAPGDLLAEKYRVIAQLGRGATGLVFEVEHELLGQRYALKLLRDASASDAKAVRRLVREARAAMRIDSPHVARAFDLGVLPDGRLFLVMELLTGRDLKATLADRGALPVDTAVTYLRQAALGVGAAHAASVVHRDLKPANLFVARAGESECLKVLDFGLSKAPELHRGAADDASLTASGSMIGSPMYMSPEQVRDPRSADERTDIWALGVVFHEMLTGEPPFTASTVAGVLAAIMVDAPRATSPAAVPAQLEQIIRDCLAKRPEERIASAVELVGRLDRWKHAKGESGAIVAIRANAGSKGLALAASLVVAAGVTSSMAGGSCAPAQASAGSIRRPVAEIASKIDAHAASTDERAAVDSAPPERGVAAPAAAPTGRRRQASPRALIPKPPTSASEPAVVFGRETDERR